MAKCVDCGAESTGSFGKGKKCVRICTRCAKKRGDKKKRKKPRSDAPKRRSQKLTKAEVTILGEFTGAIAMVAAEKIGADSEAMSTELMELLRDRLDRFDYELDDPEIWRSELDVFARDMHDEILTHARAHIQDRMGEQAWKNLGSPF